MIVEAVVLLSLLIGGALLAVSAGVRSWAVPAVGFATGCALHIVVVALLAPSGLALSPWLPVALTVALPGGWWLYHGRRYPASGVAAGAVPAVAVLAAILTIAASRAFDRVVVTPDSYDYMNLSRLMARGLLDEAPPRLLELRGLAAPAMHTPAAIGDEIYLRGLTPLLGVACVALVMWLLHSDAVARRIDTKVTASVMLLAALLLATNNRFLFHLTYINNHMAVAAWILILAGTAWLQLSGESEFEARQILPVQMLAAIAVIIARPEGAILVTLVLLPLIASARAPHHTRWMLALTLGVATVGWHAVLAQRYVSTATTPPISVIGMLGLGATICAAALVLRRWTGWVPDHTLATAEAGSWVLLLILTLRSPAILVESLRVTWLNLLGASGWGVSLLVIGAACLIAQALVRSDGRRSLRFPLTTFVPLAMILAYLRDDAYRLGPGDSLGRMLMHIFPLAVVFACSAITERRSEGSSIGQHVRSTSPRAVDA